MQNRDYSLQNYIKGLQARALFNYNSNAIRSLNNDGIAPKFTLNTDPRASIINYLTIGGILEFNSNAAPAPAAEPEPEPEPEGPPPSTGADLVNQLLDNPDFSSGTSGWTSSTGFATYNFSSGSQPAVTASINDNGIVGSDGYLVFSYVSATVSQTVAIADATILNKLTATLSIVDIPNREGTFGDDKFSFQVLFKDASNNTLYSKRSPLTGTQSAPEVFRDYILELNRADSPNFDNITSVTVSITSIDAGYWAGQHGACVDYCTLNYE